MGKTRPVGVPSQLEPARGKPHIQRRTHVHLHLDGCATEHPSSRVGAGAGNLSLNIREPKFLNDHDMWMLARDQFADSATLATGTGTLGWQDGRDSALIHISSVTRSTTDQWLHVLLTTGLVGLLSFICVPALVIAKPWGHTASRSHACCSR
jgi:hypothetical protein